MGVKGNGNACAVAGTGLTVTHNAQSVGVVWQTSSGLVTCSDFDAAAQTVKVKTGSSVGNAVIAAYDGLNGSGNILWSWHIWVTDYNPDNCTTFNFNATNPLTFMDRNLGATTNDAAQPESWGLLYQGGRKDPLPGQRILNQPTEHTIYGPTAAAVSVIFATPAPAKDNLPNSILNPLTFYTSNSWAGDNINGLWGSADPAASTAKTIFDPCPAGWRVPAFKGGISPWSLLTKDNGIFSSFYFVWASPYNAGYWPMAGYREFSNGSLAASIYSHGWYWSATNDNNKLNCFAFSSDNINFFVYANTFPSYGMSVRCVKE